MRTSSAALFLLLSLFASAQNSIRVEDDSDWWSIVRDDKRGINLHPGTRSIQASNFRIAGLDLSNVQPEQISAKLGRARIVERGDAAVGRHQVCYVSGDTSEKVHLIFEFGEVESVFYLFTGGSDWNGSEFCVKTKQVSVSLKTSSELRLGMSRTQLEAVLGKPDGVSDQSLIYSRETKKRTTPKEFEQFRKDYPEKVDDKKAHELFDFYDVQMYIEARFTKSRLNYLAVSETETN